MLCGHGRRDALQIHATVRHLLKDFISGLVALYWGKISQVGGCGGYMY